MLPACTGGMQLYAPSIYCTRQVPRGRSSPAEPLACASCLTVCYDIALLLCCCVVLLSCTAALLQHGTPPKPVFVDGCPVPTSLQSGEQMIVWRQILRGKSGTPSTPRKGRSKAGASRDTRASTPVSVTRLQACWLHRFWTMPAVL